MLKKIVVLVAGIIIAGCGQNKSIPIQPEITFHKNDFFPVTQYLLGQIGELRGLPVTPLKITTINNVSDSVWMKEKDIHSFVMPFISSIIDSSTLSAYFSEKSFLDQSINSITLSYDPVKQLPDSIEIKHWDIYIDPDDNKVSRIYILKQSKNTSAPTTIQLIWRSGYYCQVTSIIENKGLSPQVKQEKLIWNFDD